MVYIARLIIEIKPSNITKNTRSLIVNITKYLIINLNFMDRGAFKKLEENSSKHDVKSIAREEMR